MKINSLSSKETNIFFALIFIGVIMVTMLYQSRFTIENDRNSDKWGYTVYLPALFVYNFDINQIPEDIIYKTHNRFDFRGQKLYTQYSYGTALLQLPFWGTAQLISKDKSGFGTAHNKAIALSTVIYSLLGLLLLYNVLRIYFNRGVSLISILLLFFGTNLFFYSIIEAGMSHSFSFFGAALLIYSLENYTNKYKIKYFYLIVISLTLLFNIRQVDIVFGGIISLSYLIGNFDKVKESLPFKHYIYGVLIFVAFYIPQALYYYYLNESFYFNTYSTTDQGFDYWANPYFWELTFSPKFGQFLLYPLSFLMFLGVVSLPKSHKHSKISITVLVVLFFYIYGAYKVYHLGFSTGYRTFVNVLPFLILPLGYMVKHILEKRNTMLGILVIIFTCVGLKISLTTNGSYVTDPWNWDYFVSYLTSLKHLP